MKSEFLHVFPTLVASFDLSGEVDNDMLIKKMEMAGNLDHGLLENGVSSYVNGEDCFLTRLAVKDLKKSIEYYLNEYCLQGGIAPTILLIVGQT